MVDVRTPTLAEVIRVAVLSRLVDLHVSMPARVEAYDASKQSVEVVPLLMFPRVDDAGNVTMEALPKQVGIPVIFPGGGGARMTFPIQPGDFVTLVFADRSIDVWKGNASSTPVDPGVDSSHALADAFAVPGLRALAAPWTNAPTDRVSIGYDTGERIEVLPARINLSAGASQAFVLGGQYSSHMMALSTALTALSAAITPMMLPPAVAAAKAALQTAITAVNNLASDISSSVFGA